MNSNDRLKASRMLAVWLLIWMIPALDAQGVGRSVYGATYDPSNTLQAFEREHIWDRYVLAPEPKFNGPPRYRPISCAILFRKRKRGSWSAFKASAGWATTLRRLRNYIPHWKSTPRLSPISAI